MDEGLLTVEDLAKYLKVSKQTVYRMLYGDELPRYRIGRVWRFRKEDIDKWLSHGHDVPKAGEGGK